MTYKNIFVIGEKGVGKSTTMNRVMEEFGISPVGFRTLPYEIEGVRRGFYMAGLVEVSEYKNNTPISVMVGSERCVGIKETFETLGVEILVRSLEQKCAILMDELGKLESNAITFQEEVIKCLESDQMVLGVLKQCDVPFIQAIRERKDTMVFEVNKENREAVLKQIINQIRLNN